MGSRGRRLSVNSRPVWTTYRVSVQPNNDDKTLCERKKTEREKERKKQKERGKEKEALKGCKINDAGIE